MTDERAIRGTLPPTRPNNAAYWANLRHSLGHDPNVPVVLAPDLWETQAAAVVQDYAKGFESAIGLIREALRATGQAMARMADDLRRWPLPPRIHYSGHRHRGTRAWAHRYCAHRRDRCAVEMRAASA